MQAAFVFLSLWMVGSVALPTGKDITQKGSLKKLKKYPKKYDKAIHEIGLKLSEDSESSYLSYNSEGPMQAVEPPPHFPDHVYIINSSVDLAVPPVDTYSNYETLPSAILTAPSDNKRKSVYLGYTEVEDQEGEALKAPELSSYVDEKGATSGGARKDRDFSIGLRPPKPRMDSFQSSSLDGPTEFPSTKYNVEIEQEEIPFSLL